MEMKLGSNALWLLPDFKVEYKYEEPTGILQNLQNYLMCVAEMSSQIFSTANMRSIGQAGMSFLHQSIKQRKVH